MLLYIRVATFITAATSWGSAQCNTMRIVCGVIPVCDGSIAAFLMALYIHPSI